MNNIVSNLIKCLNSKVNKRNQIIAQKLKSQIFKTRKKHKRVHCNHCYHAVWYKKTITSFNKYCKQIRLSVRVQFLYLFAQTISNITTSHIWRIRTGNPILPCHGLADIDEPIQLLGGIFHTHAVHTDLAVGVLRCHKPAQQIPVIALHIQNGAVLLGIGQSVQQTFQLHLGGVLLNIVHARTKIFQVRTVDTVALLNGIDMAAVLTVEDTTVVLPCFHHHGKIRQLIGTVINVQTVDVVFQNALCSITLAVTGTLVNLHQHIKGIYQDMTGTHTGVDELDVFWIQGSVLFTNF